MASTVPVDSSSHDGAGTTDESNQRSTLREFVSEWLVWLTVVASAAIASYAAVFDRNMPNGYVPFFVVFGAIVLLYGVHDMEATPDLTGL